jgi:hypothetical protein
MTKKTLLFGFLLGYAQVVFAQNVQCNPLTMRETYDFDIGDIFIYKAYQFNFNISRSDTLFDKRTVLKKTIYAADSIVYIQKREKFWASARTDVSTVTDTLIVKNLDSSSVQHISRPDPRIKVQDVCGAYPSGRKTFLRHLYGEGIQDYCVYFQVGKGIGIVYSEWCNFQFYNTQLISYQKGNETWGMPVNFHMYPNYVPFPKEGSWYKQSLQQTHPLDKRIYQYLTTLKGDTVIKGNTYAKIYHKLMNRGGSDYSYIGALRETPNKEIMHIEVQDSVEKLMYKFGLNVGDTLYLPTRRDKKTIKVLAIDSVQIQGIFRKRYRMDTQTLGQNDYWIEGIGSTKGLFYPYREGEFENSESLLCFETNEGIIFKHESVVSQCFISSTDDRQAHKNSVKAYPNPMQGWTIFELSIDKSSYDFELIDISGKVIRKDKFEGKQYEFSRNGLPVGIYLYKISVAGIPLSIGKLIVL